jgi:5-methylcytosine-specific restriction enzyme subunit McrC
MCTQKARPSLRTAYRILLGLTSLVPCGPKSCSGRQYNRLNEDYSHLHALCRFFLDQTGPSHQMGTEKMLPFLVDMSRLYELFVAEWLRTHLPVEFMMKSQEKVRFGQDGALGFLIDLMLYDAHTGKARYVLDTKYKTSPTPSPTDVAQVIAYGEAKGCQEVVLVYPSASIERVDERIGSKRLRTLPFSIEGDLEEAGQKFLDMLLN